MSKYNEAFIRGVVACVLVWLACAGIIFVRNEAPRWSAAPIAAAWCAEDGYVEHLEYRGIFYCISYGLEPRVVRLGTIAAVGGE